MLRIGYEDLLQSQIELWDDIWKKSDIIIPGMLRLSKEYVLIFFNLIKHTWGKILTQCWSKRFTGENMVADFWDTDLLSFYLSTKKSKTKNLLIYRFNQLEKAILNAEKLGLNHGAALYPMVTVNGEECHNDRKLRLKRYIEIFQW